MNKLVEFNNKNSQSLFIVRDLKPESIRFFGPLFNFIKRCLRILDSILYRGFSREYHPIVQSGAIANLLFGIAVITGIVLLFWYKPSVHQAYISLENLKSDTWFAFLGQWIRSLHRYSSDAAMLFIGIHFLKEISDQKIGGARWLAWITGFLSIGIFWFEGWTGYWLVWDVRAQQVALGTSKMLDLVPIFADPLSRTFLTDEHINTLLFFLIFFFHMLLPLAIVLGLWLHINRLNRSNWITTKPVTIWVLISLMIISILKPAYSVEAAKMQVIPSYFTMDYWFLLPLWITDRLGGGMLWGITFLLTILVFGFPWIFFKKRWEPSVVDEERCQNCQQCFIDCPYNAISMIPRKDREPTARVNPDLCVSCGICNGSCLPVSVGIPYYHVIEKRRLYQKWKQEAKKQNRPFYLAFVCANSIANDVQFQSDTGMSSHPIFKDFYVSAVPCIGWVHSRTLELLLKEDNSGAVIIGCADCTYREGNIWLEERIFNDRDPALRKDKVDMNKIKIIYPNSKRELQQELERFPEEIKNRNISHILYKEHKRNKLLVFAFLATLLFSFIIVIFSEFYYHTPFDGNPYLIVSFKHPGQVSENCRELSEEEIKKLPVHMRKKKICERKRSPVRMAIYIDGNQILQKSYRPGGLWEDLNSIALEEFPVEEGIHTVKILIGDTHKKEWNYQYEKKLQFKKWKKRVILFDKVHHFQEY